MGPDGRKLPGLSAGRVGWGTGNCPQIAYTYRIWPHLSEGEGHFLALLEKQEGGGRPEKAPKKGRRKGPGTWKDKEGIKLLKECLGEILCREEAIKAEEAADTARLAAFGEQIYLIPEGMPDIDKLRVSRPGLH